MQYHVIYFQKGNLSPNKNRDSGYANVTQVSEKGNFHINNLILARFNTLINLIMINFVNQD